MGLLGAPASFQHLMKIVVHGLPNIIMQIEDLLLHFSSHPKHLEQLYLHF
jgi:hypothetical protein